MILHDFNIICGMVCDPIKDGLFKRRQKHQRKSVIISKDVGLK